MVAVALAAIAVVTYAKPPKGTRARDYRAGASGPGSYRTGALLFIRAEHNREMQGPIRIYMLASQISISSQVENRIIDTATEHAQRARENLGISWSVSITIYPNEKWAVPETGEGGYTPSADWSQIYLDLTGTKHSVEQVVSERLPTAIYHEMNHLKRWRTVGYGSDLESALVSEGLASVYERTMFPTYCVPWLNYSQQDVDTLLSIIHEHKKGSIPYVHSNWFFGTNPNIPKWLGYTVGHYIVSQALEKNTHLRLIDMMEKSAFEILRASSVEL